MRLRLPQTVAFLALFALCVLPACSEDEGGTDAVTLPCDGLCPADQCFANTCLGANNGENNGANNGANNGENNGANNGENNGANNGANNGGNNGEEDAGMDVADVDDASDMGEDTSDVPDDTDDGGDDTSDMGEDMGEDTPDVPDESCDDDDDCEDHEVCSDRECVQGCDDDEEEGNDTFETATTVEVAVGDNERVRDLTLCSFDSDWFFVSLAEGDTLVAGVTQDGGPVVPLAVLASDGVTVLQTTLEEGNSRSVTATAENADGFYVRVGPLDEPGRTGAAYELNLGRTESLACVADAHEPNDDANGATRIGAGTVEGRLCRDDADIDYYELGLLAGDNVDLTLSYDHGMGPIPATIYGPGGLDDPVDFFLVDNGDDDVPSGGTLVIDGDNEGDWLVGIESEGPGMPLDYELQVDIDRDDPNCDVPDLNEPNDTCANATTLAPFTDIDGYVCGPGGDEDWFRVTVGDGNDLTIRVEHFHFDGNLELQVQDENDAVVGFSFNSGPNFEEVMLENPGAGTYCAKVFVRSGIVENDYTISAAVQ